MIYVIFGPTASGKTYASNELAKRLSAPILNGDAFQIYQDMDIGTNKLSKDDPMYKNTYMIDIVSPEETFSVMEYQKYGREVLDKLLKEHKDVIISGGTGLYIRALLFDYVFLQEDEYPLDDLMDEASNEELHKILEELDPVEAEKIHVNNRKRMLRAIAMMKNNNIVKSEHIANQEHKLVYPNLKFLFINPPREELYQRINDRVDEMMKMGLVDEVKGLLDKYDLSLTAKAGIGYKEVISFLNDEISLNECVELIKKRTRNYAKRQVTFFKHQFPNLETFSSYEELLQKYE